MTSVLYDELLGADDVMLRTWLPSVISVSECQRDLVRHLEPLNLISLNAFLVDAVVRNWIWLDSDGHGLRRPSRDRVERLMPENVEAVSSGEGVEADLGRLVEANLIAPVWPSQGIRFYVAVSLGGRLGHHAVDHAEAALADVVDRAIGIDEPAMYRGTGFATFLVSGKATTDQFLRLETDLLRPLNQAVAHVDGRISTMLASTPEVVWHTDQPVCSTAE